MDSGVYNATINDNAFGVAETDGGFMVGGYVQGAALYDVMLLKTTSGLDSTWLKTYGGPGSDVAYCMKRTPDSGFVLAGYRTITETGKVNAWVLRANAAGDTLWTRTAAHDTSNWFQSVDVTSDGGYVFAGLWAGTSLATRDCYVVKLAGDGAVEWGNALRHFNRGRWYGHRADLQRRLHHRRLHRTFGFGSPGRPGGQDRSDERHRARCAPESVSTGP